MNSSPFPLSPAIGDRVLPRLRSLKPYFSGVNSENIDLWLDANEGLWPLADSELASADAIRRYPRVADLEAELARYHSVEPQQVLVTAGGDDAIDRLMRAVVAPGDQVVLTTPTFEMIERYASIAGALVRSVPWWGGAYPSDEVLGSCTAATSVVAIVSPNNPTGAAISRAALEGLLPFILDKVVMLDLAYAEFCDEDLMPVMRAAPNIVAIRTFSKAFGMAGMRVGYAIGPHPLIAAMRCVAGPYPVSTASLALAATRLKNAATVLPSIVSQNASMRARLQQELERAGGRPLASQANFLLAEFPDAAAVRRQLALCGISVRAFPSSPLLTNFLRVTCPRTEPEFQRLQAALQEVQRTPVSRSSPHSQGKNP